jgi:hypothetical protein
MTEAMTTGVIVTKVTMEITAVRAVRAVRPVRAVKTVRALMITAAEMV